MLRIKLVVVAAVILITGCAKQSDLETLQQSHQQLQISHQALKRQLSELQKQNQSLQQIVSELNNKTAQIQEKTSKIKMVGDANAMLIVPNDSKNRIMLNE